MKKTQGFSLIELMIVIAIIAVISAIAYPSYQESVRKANRADAMETILDTAQRLERCYTSYGSYDNASCPIANGATVTSIHEHYEVDVTSAPATYSLTATPVSDSQLADEKCTTFVLDQTGRKTATGTDSDRCW